MKRRGFHRNLLTLAAAAAAGPLLGPAPARAAARRAVCRRTVTEYALPPAAETHEIVKLPGKPVVLVSQMSDSRLVKLRLDPDTEEVVGVGSAALGPSDAMLHGLAVSRRHPGRVWATHEAGNRLLLVDPRPDDLDAPPRVERAIDVPGGGKGPHYVGEFDDELWVTLKGSDQVLAIDHSEPSRFRLFPAKPHPIFIARHPVGGDFYVSQDQSSSLLRIDPGTGRARQIPVPADRGSTPVGLVAGAGAVWVVLLGTAESGTGTFGRIDERGRFTWFRLKDPAARSAGLLHLAFDPPHGLWLLGSSIVSSRASDQIVRVEFDSSYSTVLDEQVAALPTQLCKAHRILALPGGGVLATELTSATVARLAAGPMC
ncbi:hypothetical protein [Streptomyces luteireticuli]|uniref:YncE family protein n=1 Tax=Streptomyces luteireticuli TaxID=173858 RepID=A0ABN0Z6Z0_9ACTN